MAASELGDARLFDSLHGVDEITWFDAGLLEDAVQGRHLQLSVQWHDTSLVAAAQEQGPGGVSQVYKTQPRGSVTFLNASAAEEMVFSICSSVWARLTNQHSNCEGGR